MRYWFLLLALAGLILPAADEVVVYSSRNEHLIKPIFAAFTKKTGIEVKYQTGNAGGLIERLKAEGKRTRADLFLTVDAGNLWHAQQLGLLAAVDSDILKKNVPAHLRDPGNHWFGLSIRVRSLVYNTNKIKAEDLTGYTDLASEKWQGKLLLRTSKKVYNQSLVAMLIEQMGAEKTSEVLNGWVKNLAAPVFPNDTKLMEALAKGVGSVGIVNSYYYGRLIRKNPDLPLKLFWADQNDTGVHVNISGAGLTANAKHPKLGQKLLEWLASEEGQFLLARENLEYPANPAVAKDPLVASWGDFKPMKTNLTKAGERQKQAIKLMDQAGYK